MAGNSFGQLFRITTYGESHGPVIGVVVDGCPAGVEIDPDLIAAALRRRRPGQSELVSPRKEEDLPEILSGVYLGRSTGAPICMQIRNMDQRPGDYKELEDRWRPGHADFTYDSKYGFRDPRGGGRSSARETAARVMGGAIAGMVLSHHGISIQAWVSALGTCTLDKDYHALELELTEKSPVRCPDPQASTDMVKELEEARAAGNTIGGVISCVARKVPAGLGEPVFGKLQADLAGAMMSINAAKGFEYGSGFASARMRGSEHNDLIQAEVDPAGHPRFHTLTNHSGGIQGGISNGEDLFFRVAFKPVSTLMREQPGVDRHGNPVVLEGKGRHDPCVVPRAVPIVEAMCALVLADHLLRHRSARL